MTTEKLMKTETHVDAPEKGLIVIERTHPSQTDHGLAVLSHIANQPDGCGFNELYAVFLQAKGSRQVAGTNAQNLRAMLGHMQARGYVETSGRKGARLYRLGDLGKLPSTTAGAEIKAAIKANTQAASQCKATDWFSMPAPARQYDVMYGPVYVPGPSAAPRAGSLDFMRCPSHGYGC